VSGRPAREFAGGRPELQRAGQELPVRRHLLRLRRGYILRYGFGLDMCVDDRRSRLSGVHPCDRSIVQ
jgi:hypothetical protein